MTKPRKLACGNRIRTNTNIKHGTDPLNTVTSVTTDSHREKGSKFIGYLFPATDKDDFERRLEEIRTKYPDATHQCYAWRCDPADLKEFAQDDGEPRGTAGPPILNQLKSFETVNAGLVVVRYFGGTKLGKSGLIEAYGQTAAQCLEKAVLQPIRLVRNIEITYPYSVQNTIEQLMHRFGIVKIDSVYAEDVTLTLACPLQQADDLKKNLEHAVHLGIKARFLEKGYI